MQVTESDVGNVSLYIKIENMQNSMHMFIMLMRTQGHFTQGTDTEGYINVELRRVVTSGERKRLVNEVVGGNLQRYCKITVLKKRQISQMLHSDKAV